MSIYRIDTNLTIPIYQQLVDMTRVAVKKGDLASGQQLPTVQELSQELGVARGTIKRAYDELEHEGLIEKVQGRGTFVCYQPANSGSRKEQAMAAIDQLLNQLEDMGLTAPEINIFINLKMTVLLHSLRLHHHHQPLIPIACFIALAVGFIYRIDNRFLN